MIRMSQTCLTIHWFVTNTVRGASSSLFMAETAVEIEPFNTIPNCQAA